MEREAGILALLTQFIENTLNMEVTIFLFSIFILIIEIVSRLVKTKEKGSFILRIFKALLFVLDMLIKDRLKKQDEIILK